MAKHRSPNYPAHGLSDAVEFARQIYAKEKRSQAPSEIIAKALGYSSLSGNARVKIATLKKYGLLDGDESKGMRLSDLAMQLLYPDSSLQEADARKTAALTPSLFRSLFDEKAEASDDAITNYLIGRMDFSPIGAKQAIEAFRDTMAFAGLSGSAYNAFRTSDGLEAQTVQPETRSASTVEVPTVGPAQGSPNYASMLKFTRAQLQPPPENTHTWDWTLSVPRGVNANLIIFGELKRSDLARLKRQIEFLEESFDDETEEAAQ